MTEHQPASRTERALLAAVDKGLDVQAGTVAAHVRKLRAAHPDETPAKLIARLEKRFLSTVTASGASVGLAAATPGVGTAVALGATGVDSVFFFEASALFTLAVAEVHGVPVHETEHRRALVLTVLLGSSGSALFEQAAGRTGKYWGQTFTRSVPTSALRNINKVLGQNFVTKYGTRQGIITIGKVAPAGFGALIGGGGNHFMGRTVVKGARSAFGPAPLGWHGQPDLTVLDVEALDSTR